MRYLASMVGLVCVILAGCESDRREPEGRRVAVRAPYANVDVFIPDDDDDDVRVDVDVDD